VLHLATWNVNSVKARFDHLLRWLKEADPDVVCLQELKSTDDQFPAAEVAAAGWPHQLVWGQRTYNGVAIVSKRPLSDPQKGFRTGGGTDEQARLVAATADGVRVYGVYVPNGQEVGSDKFAYKLDFYARMRAELDPLDPAGRVAVCGDWNVAPTDQDVWDAFAAEGQVMFHPLEKQAMANVLAWGLTDAYRTLRPDGREYTWWDYRQLGFQRNHGWRIDHVMVSKPLVPLLREVQIWRPVRKWEKPSDHVPLSVRLEV
jgi:exodeoxyribonuclease-3